MLLLMRLWSADCPAEKTIQRWGDVGMLGRSPGGVCFFPVLRQHCLGLMFANLGPRRRGRRRRNLIITY